jgi:hypothetical protein
VTELEINIGEKMRGFMLSVSGKKEIFRAIKEGSSYWKYFEPFLLSSRATDR